jgi:hypothetical protein
MGKTVVGVLTYADVCGRMRTYAIYICAAAAVVPVARPDAYRLQSECRRHLRRPPVLTLRFTDVCGRMRTYAMYASSTACSGTQFTLY